MQNHFWPNGANILGYHKINKLYIYIIRIFGTISIVDTYLSNIRNYSQGPKDKMTEEHQDTGTPEQRDVLAQGHQLFSGTKSQITKI